MTLRKKAEAVRKAGFKNSGQDSVLAHITPREQNILKAYGGSGRKDPKTGLRHYDDPGIGDPGVSDGIGVPADPSGDPGIDGQVGNIVGFDPDINSNDIGNENSVTVGFDPNDSNPATNPSTDESVISKLFKGVLGNLANHAIGLPVSNFANIVANPPTNAVQGVAPIAGMLGSTIGNAVAPGIGGIIGGQLGNMAADSFSGVPNMSSSDTASMSADNASSGINGTTGAFGNAGDWAGLGTGLAGLWQGHQASQAYGGAVDAINQMYSPDSPYAKMMQQALERKDAAAGRRSQYGDRGVQLAAALTDARTRALTSPGYGNLMAKNQQGQNMGMNTLLALLGSKTGKGMMNQGGSWLSNLFNNQTGSGGTNLFAGGGNGAPSYGDWMTNGGGGNNGGDYQDIMGDWGG